MFLEFENFVEFVEILISVTLNVSFNVVAITYINNFQSFFFDFIFEVACIIETASHQVGLDRFFEALESLIGIKPDETLLSI